jgi:hypothetical protein
MTTDLTAPTLADATMTQGSNDIEITGRFIRIARLQDEWYRDLGDPAPLIDSCRSRGDVDLFTFWQRLPESHPKYTFAIEWDSIAVLPVSTFDHWWRQQINNKTRNLVVKAKKKGVVVKRAVFDEHFIGGMSRIFNETPIRQERAFVHYGKDAETVKKEFSRYLFREELLGAYLGDELIGFAMVANAGRYAMLGQIISMVRHRDKSPTNALIAAAVELCAERRFPALVYALWPKGSLMDFKKHNGFECVRLPRFYVPVTARGRIALSLGFHRKMSERLPEATVSWLKGLRAQFYIMRYRRETFDAAKRSA